MLKAGFESSRSKLMSGELGLWAQVAACVGIHATASVDASSDAYIRVQSLETLAFHPDDEYIRRSVGTPEVMAYLSNSRYSTPLYMITAIKVARGASMSSDAMSGAELNAGVDAPLPDAQIGPKVRLQKHRGEYEAFEKSSDFILAFRLERIRFRVNQGQVSVKDYSMYIKHAKLMDSQHEVREIDHVFDGLDQEAEELQTSLESMADKIEGRDDDDAICQCVYLKHV